MLTFIYINNQLLQRLDSLPPDAGIPQGPTWYNINEELEEQLKDEAFAILKDPIYEDSDDENEKDNI